MEKGIRRDCMSTNVGFTSFVYNYIDERWFTTEDKFDENGVAIPPLAQNNPKRIIISIIRETIGPFIDRSDDPEETINVRLPDGRKVVEIPARKMKSKEKLLGLRLARAFGAVPAGYEYNAIRSSEMLKNPNSVIFGDTVVDGNDQAMMPSRVVYSSSYSIRDRTQITQRLTHNALSEGRTMWDRATGEYRTSLFTTEYVKPATFFPSFITLDDPTPEALMHVIMCLKESRYGAQTSITGPNMKNHIVAIMACQVEPPVSSYSISESSADLVNSITLDAVAQRVISNLEKYNGDLLYGDDLKTFLAEIDNLSETDLEKAYTKLKSDAERVWEYCGFDKKKKRNSKKDRTGSEE